MTDEPDLPDDPEALARVAIDELPAVLTERLEQPWQSPKLGQPAT